MPGSGNNGTVRILLTEGSARSGDIYQRYASGLYRQALLSLGDSARRDGRPVPPSGNTAGRAGPGGFLSEQERAALGLVLIGGLGRVRASRVLGICPRDVVALLRTASLRLATSSAAVAENSRGTEAN
jgi:hypothetical protein